VASLGAVAVIGDASDCGGPLMLLRAAPSKKCDGEPQSDQRVETCDRDAETNVGHNAVRWELDLSGGHRSSPRRLSRPTRSRAKREIVPAKCSEPDLMGKRRTERISSAPSPWRMPTIKQMEKMAEEAEL
jgi:hypothetical protein